MKKKTVKKKTTKKKLKINWPKRTQAKKALASAPVNRSAQLAQAAAQIQISDPVVNEIAGEIGFDLERFQFLNKTHDSNPIHENPKFSGLHLFYEMDTDSRIYNVMRILKDGLMRRQSWIRPGDNSEDQAIKTAFAILNLKRISALKQKKKETMGCLDYGYSVVEKILARETVELEYEFDKQKKKIILRNAIVINDLKSRPVTAFWFDEFGKTYFAGNLKNAPFFGMTFQQSREARPLNDEELQHFMITTHDPRFGSKYGWSVKVSMFPPYLMKKTVKLWRLINVQRNGMPIPHGKYKPGTPRTGPGGTDEFKKRLSSLQHAAFIMTPEGFTVEFLKAIDAGDMDVYQNLLDYCDYEIAEAGLGHREATSQAGTGSYASEVLKSTAIRQEILEANGGTLDTAFNDQFIRPLIDWNFPSSGVYPKQYTDTTAMRDLSATISQFETGHSIGVPLDLDQIYEDMSWRKPVDPERTLEGNTSHVFPDRSDRTENPSQK